MNEYSLLIVTLLAAVIGYSHAESNGTYSTQSISEEFKCIQCNPCIGGLPEPTICEPKNTGLLDKELTQLYRYKACTKIVKESASGVRTYRGCTWYPGNKTQECIGEDIIDCVYYCEDSGCNEGPAFLRQGPPVVQLCSLVIFVILCTVLRLPVIT